MMAQRLLALAAVGGASLTVAARVSRDRRSRSAAAAVRSAATDAALAGARNDSAADVVVVIAALNEAASLGSVLSAIEDEICEFPVRVVVVDDGSNDDTGAAAARYGAVVARHHSNLGQGDALRTGFAIALGLGAEVVVTLDADGQHDPSQITDLVKPILADEADYVQGSRFLGTYDDAGGARHAGIKVLTALITLLTHTEITDCANGFRAIRASGLARMRLCESRFSAAEIIIEAAGRGLRMQEVPVHVRSREVGQSRKPRGLGYPLGYLAAICRSWARSRFRPRAAESARVP